MTVNHTILVFAVIWLTGCPAEPPVANSGAALPSTSTPDEPAQAARDSSVSSRQAQVRGERVEHLKQLKARVDRENALQNWTLVRHNLWRNTSGDIAFRTKEMTEEGIGIVHYRTQLGGDGPSLKDGVDLGTFRHLRGSFYRDKDHIFHHFEMADGGTFYILEKVDKDSFQVMTDCYARDKNAIYTDRAKEVDGADLASFYTSEDVAGCFAKDNKSYFFWDERIRSAAELDAPGRDAIKQLGPL